jgi:hypothetical protein
MDLDSFLVSLYVLVDDWWQESRSTLRRPGRPALLSDPEILTLAILPQWPRFRSERDFWRFASSHLRCYFPNLCIVRVRASRKGLFCGQATFGRSASKTEWIYGFKVALVVDPYGVVTVFGLAQASSDERPIGDAIVASDRHEAYLADKGFTGVVWERRWMEEYGSLVAATPKNDSRRAWPETDRRWAAGKRQIIEGVICQLKDFFGWSVTGRRRWAGCWRVFRPRSRPTPALNGSTTPSADPCATWRTCWS